jgi:hypothetical protein
MFSYLKDLLTRKVGGIFAPRKPRSASPKPPRHLVLQLLEDRSVPSASTVEMDAYPDTARAADSTSGYGWSGYKWAQSSDGYYHITYSYYNVLSGQLNGLDASIVKEVFQEAMRLWASYAPLIFTEVSDSGENFTNGQSYDRQSTHSADIRIGSTYIDGQNGTLAYTYYPSSTANGLAGDIVFDSSEKWATNPKNGTDLLEVATHELGHALGLGHSTDSSAIMYPYYGGRFSGLGTGYLTSSDVSAIQSVYGGGQGSVTPLSALANVLGNSGGGSQPSFQVSGSTLIVNGTSGNDIIYYFAGTSSQTVSIDGKSYTIDPSKIKKVVIVGYGGNDTLYVTGSSDDETAILCPGYGVLSSKDYAVYWTGIETVDLISGHGNDRAYFYDTVGNAYFVGARSYSNMTGNGYSNYTTNYSYNAAYSGGHADVAYFYSSGNAVFVGTPSESYLYGSGWFDLASGFSTNVAYNTGGSSVAYFIASSGNDTFVGTPTYSYLSGSNYLDMTVGFSTNVAYATGGGNESAYYYDAAGNNVFVCTSNESYMYGSGYLNLAVGFSSNTAYAIHGTDTAYLFGNGNDSFTAYRTSAILAGSGYRGAAYGFSSVYVFDSGSGNRAYLDGYSYYLAMGGVWS